MSWHVCGFSKEERLQKPHWFDWPTLLMTTKDFPFIEDGGRIQPSFSFLGQLNAFWSNNIWEKNERFLISLMCQSRGCFFCFLRKTGFPHLQSPNWLSFSALLMVCGTPHLVFLWKSCSVLTPGVSLMEEDESPITELTPSSVTRLSLFSPPPPHHTPHFLLNK